MFDIETIKIIAAGSTGSAIVLLSLYFSRDAILSAMNRSAQKELEKQKAELQKDLEKWKSDLEREKDRYRHDLARDAAKITMYNEKSHELYAQIFELLRKAEGAVGALFNIYYSLDWSIAPAESARNYFTKLGASTEAINDALLHIETNRDLFARDGLALENRMRLLNTDKAIDEFRNLIILKELYLSQELHIKLFDVRTLLHGAVSGFAPHSPSDGMLKGYEQYGKIKPLIEDIRKLMQSELRGS